MDKGYVHIYTGNGKGKTTSAIGLMTRAVGAGLSVYFGQFMKGGDYSEIKILRERFPEITIDQYGGGCIINRAADTRDNEAAKDGFIKALDAVNSGKYDMVVLDEINVALFMDLINKDELLNMIKNKPENVELILTGRYANDDIIKAADVVSDITQVKHYFNNGIVAREGIEM